MDKSKRPAARRVSAARRAAHIVWAVVACALASGCASPPPPNLDLHRAALLPDLSAPTLSLHGSSSKVTGAAAGAAKGAGAGFLGGLIGCGGTGPLVAICVGVVVPVAMTIGVVSGATVGALRSESADAVDAKRAMLTRELAATAYPVRLAQLLQAQARDRFAIELPLADAAHAPTDWTIEVALREVATDNSLPDHPFSLQLEGRLRLRHAGDATVVFERTAYVTSAASLTTAQWRAEDAAPVRAALEQSLDQLADRLLGELCRPPASGSVCHRSSNVEPAVGGGDTPFPSPAASPASKEVS